MKFASLKTISVLLQVGKLKKLETKFEPLPNLTNILPGVKNLPYTETYTLMEGKDLENIASNIKVCCDIINNLKDFNEIESILDNKVIVQLQNKSKIVGTRLICNNCFKNIKNNFKKLQLYGSNYSQNGDYVLLTVMGTDYLLGNMGTCHIMIAVKKNNTDNKYCIIEESKILKMALVINLNIDYNTIDRESIRVDPDNLLKNNFRIVQVSKNLKSEEPNPKMEESSTLKFSEDESGYMEYNKNINSSCDTNNKDFTSTNPSDDLPKPKSELDSVNSSNVVDHPTDDDPSKPKSVNSSNVVDHLTDNDPSKPESVNSSNDVDHPTDDDSQILAENLAGIIDSIDALGISS